MSHQNEQSDSAAIFACALSLWRECMRRSQAGKNVNLSECYNGGDEFMRVIMRVGTRFESWASCHVQFENLEHCWPYFLEEKFGEVCVGLKDVTSLDGFCDEDCLVVGLRLGLPVKAGGSLPVPVDESAGNPVLDSEFRRYRIQTLRESSEGDIEPFIRIDDPFDGNYGPRFFGVYGVCSDGMLEHISSFDTYSEAVRFVRKLAPGIQFPEMPTAVSL